MTTTIRDTLRTIVIPLMVLAVLLGIPGQSAVGGATVVQSGNRVGAARTAALHRMSNGRIAINGGPFLAVINPDGTGYQQLASACPRNEGGDFWFWAYAWSPDGRRIAFLRGKAGGMRTPSTVSLCVINADGSREKRLARCDPSGCGAFLGSRLSWSPDGSRVAFTRGSSLTIVNTQTGRLRRITSCPYPGPAGKSRCVDLSPAWSPDGSRILFARWFLPRNVSELFVTRPDGSGLRRVTSPHAYRETDAVWSPDGRSIAFDSGNRIYSVHADGSHLRALVSGPQGSGPGVPSWSPDGTHVVYASTPRYGAHNQGAYRLEVWVMNPNGTGHRRLYHSVCCTGGPGWPTWSPDGRYIAFTAQISSDHAPNSAPAIYVMDADGRHLHRLHPAFDSPVAWQPIP